MSEKKEKSIWGERLTTVLYIAMLLFIVAFLYQSVSLNFFK